MQAEGRRFDSDYLHKTKEDIQADVFFCFVEMHRVAVPYLCLGALPLLYPAAQPSVFDYCIVKYTALAVALVREYVVELQGVL